MFIILVNLQILFLQFVHQLLFKMQFILTNLALEIQVWNFMASEVKENCITNIRRHLIVNVTLIVSHCSWIKNLFRSY